MSGPVRFVRRWGEELIAGGASGLLLALCFPPFSSRYLAAVALVPFLRYFHARLPLRAGELAAAQPRGGRRKSLRRIMLERGFGAGFALGVVFFTTLLYWILNLIPASGVVTRWILFPALVLLVGYLSCYTAIFGLGLSWFASRLGHAALWAAPALWALVEYARSHGELAFSWGVLANALAARPAAIQSLAVYGVFGLSFVLVLLNVLAVIALCSRSRRSRFVAGAAFAALAGGHLLWGTAEIERFDRSETAIGGARAIAVVQPNIDLSLKWEEAYRDSIFRQMERYVALASREGARLVVFPETAAPVSFKASPEYLGRLQYAARESDIDILTGYVDHSNKGGEWRSHNAAILIARSGLPAGNYHKVNLLPFGEKMPWSQYLPALSKLDFGQANFIAGTKRTIFESEAGGFGVLICYEAAFAGYTRRYVLDGADFLVNITNDGWFGPGPGPRQHAEMAILRAVENRVTLARAAYTGVSMIVDPVGRIHERIGLFAEGMILGAPLRAAGGSFYTRHGDAAFFVMALASIVLAGALARREGGRPPGA